MNVLKILNNKNYVLASECNVRYINILDETIGNLKSEIIQSWYNKIHIDFKNYIFIVLKDHTTLLTPQNVSYSPDYHKMTSTSLKDEICEDSEGILAIMAIYNTIYMPEKENIVESCVEYYNCSNINLYGLCKRKVC